MVSRADEFRKNADECRQQAERAINRLDKERWLKIAEHCLQQEADDPSKELASYMKQNSKRRGRHLRRLGAAGRSFPVWPLIVSSGWPEQAKLRLRCNEATAMGTVAFHLPKTCTLKSVVPAVLVMYITDRASWEAQNLNLLAERTGLAPPGKRESLQCQSRRF